MKGRRVYLNNNNELWIAPGDYGKDERGHWMARPPCGMGGVLTEAPDSGDLSLHEVVEHEDGTITVSPSILITQPPLPEWHGFLERGVWRTA